MSQPETVASPVAPPYQDRKTVLAVMGVLLVVGGVLCGCMSPMMFLSSLAAPHAGSQMPPPQPSELAGIAAFYLAMAAACITLGIGSFNARRWARALVLVGAWLSLVIGIIALVICLSCISPAVLSRQFAAAGVPADNTMPLYIGLAVAGVFMFLLLVAVPLVFILVYRSPHVKATCEARNPAPCWTDRCPLPVLALVVLMSWSLAWLPFMILGRYPVPFFGCFLTGWAAAAVTAAAGVFLAFAIRGLYRLQAWALWSVIAAAAAFCASYAVTIKTCGLMAMYEAMQYPPEKLDYLRGHMPFSDNAFLLMQAAWLAAFAGYGLWLRRFFRKPPPG